MHLQDALDDFLLQLDADGRSPHTIAQYSRHVRAYIRWAASAGGGLDADGVTRGDLARFLTADAARTRPDGRPKKPTSANALRTSLRYFFGHLHAAGDIPTNPARLIRRAVCGPPPPRALTEDEVDRLRAAMARGSRSADTRDHALFGLMLATGIRLGSALALDVEDLDLGRAELRVRYAKRAQEQRVFLNPQICGALDAYLGSRSEGPVFTTSSQRRLSHRQAHRRLAAWAREAGIRGRVSPHTLRHSFAARLYRRTGDLGVVKAALGHRSIASTLVYARCDEDRLRGALGA